MKQCDECGIKFPKERHNACTNGNCSSFANNRIRVVNARIYYDCTLEDALRFIELREEGYSVYQSAVLAGLSDPDY